MQDRPHILTIAMLIEEIYYFLHDKYNDGVRVEVVEHDTEIVRLIFNRIDGTTLTEIPIPIEQQPILDQAIQCWEYARFVIEHGKRKVIPGGDG